MTNQKTITALLSTTMLAFPVLVWAQVGIPCDGPDCDFNDLITLVNNIIHFLMYDVAVPLAALGFMWAGGRLVIMQDKEGEWNKAKESFGNIAMGFAMMIAAYVLIKTVLFAFLTTEQTTFMGFFFQ